MDKEKFGSLIREYRTRQGLSIRKFSQVSGVSTTQIQSIETASITTEPTVATINKLVAGLDLEDMESSRVRQAAGFVIPVDEYDRYSMTKHETAMLDKIRKLPTPFKHELDRMLDGWLRAFEQDK